MPLFSGGHFSPIHLFHRCPIGPSVRSRCHRTSGKIRGAWYVLPFLYSSAGKWTKFFLNKKSILWLLPVQLHFLPCFTVLFLRGLAKGGRGPDKPLRRGRRRYRAQLADRQAYQGEINVRRPFGIVFLIESRHLRLARLSFLMRTTGFCLADFRAKLYYRESDNRQTDKK